MLKYAVLFALLALGSFPFFGVPVIIPLGIAYILGYGQASKW